MKSRRRHFNPEFKNEAVRLAKSGEQSIAAVARDLGIAHSLLGHWIKQYDIDHGKGPEGALTPAEKEELQKLRRENRRLKMEREILKKATAFFARENE